ncbi:GNAT family N-acetyltransferase [Cellulosimicrobium cellulans]|uniref:GNAT family N-acetyltransferase n=1 Tax=Cellulosimicrobium cellulans TaxID=1710 RepID=UPI00130EC1B4|nr:GNAT family N-acetyltransferase [Cellulosimicrobium cellulans]
MVALFTRRLHLRPLVISDLQSVQAYAEDPEVCRHVAWGPWTPEQTRGFVDQVVAEWASAHQASYTFAVTTGEVMVGSCAITVTSREHRRAELGYVLARSHWARGYASEAAGAVLRFGLDNLGLGRVEATCRPANVASQNVLRKIGMAQEGRMRSHVVIRGQSEDSLLFAAIR